MAWFVAAIPYIATAAGTVMQSSAQMQAAEDTRNIANYKKRIAERSAIAVEATSQQQAKEAKRQARLQQSRVLALAAASGGNALDPDIMNIIAGFEEEGELEARTILYEGLEQAKAYRSQGDIGVYESFIKSKAYQHQATATIMEGASSLASKYGEYLQDKKKK